MKKLPLCIIFVLFTVISCANVQTTSYFSTAKVKLSDYSALEIQEFESAVENFPKEALTIIPNLVVDKLRSKDLKFDSIFYGEVDNASPEETLVVLGEISKYVGGGDIRYEPGNVKFGEVDINVDVVILQKSNGRDIASGEVSSLNSASFLGGTDKMYEEIANEIVEYIMQNY